MLIKTHKLFTLLTLFAVLGAVVAPLAPVQAISVGDELSDKLTNVGGAAGFQDTDPRLAQIIGRIIQGLLSVLGLVFMGYILYAGQLWLTARGNEERIDKAKAIIRGSIIGLIVVMASYAISIFVIDRAIEATNYNPTTTATE